MIRDCKLIAEKNKTKFKFNSYFPIKTLNLMRGVLVAKEDDILSFYIDKIFDSIWKDGLNMNDQNIIDKVLKNIDINPKTFFLRSSNQNIKDLLKKKTNEAFDKGVFGAPTFFVNNKLFWGQDRLDYALTESQK
jgi:2-hydroxychromene-2-carboxylate isomerase